jgi:phosphoribosylanthranilate isomerase
VPRTWIKICANTSLEDSQAALAAGADALGFIFAESKRQVTAEQVKAITRELPTAMTIGVFANQPIDEVAHTVVVSGITGVQLHGDEDIKYVRTLRERVSRSLTVLKSTMPLQGDMGALAELIFAVDAVVVDSSKPYGGTGKAFDWMRAVDFMLALQQHAKVIVAGGLNAENVGSALALFSPYGVDVASGVEQSPGKKDISKIRAFIAAVRATESKAAVHG